MRALDGIDDERDGAASNMRPGDAFWSEFREHAGVLPRESPRPAFMTAVARVAVACACLLLAVCSAYFIWPGRSTPGAQPVQALAIDMSYDAVMIMEGTDRAMTILWVDET